MKAMIEYLSGVQLIPSLRFVQAMKTLVGVTISKGRVYNGLTSYAHTLRPIHTALRDLVRDARSSMPMKRERT